MTKLQLPGLVADTDRHGNVRFYFRRKGEKKIRIYGEPGSSKFLEEYGRARDGKIEPAKTLRRPATGTLGWLREAYYSSAEYRQLGPATRQARRLILDGICETMIGDKRRGELPFAKMEGQHVRKIRDEKADKPEAANSRVKALRQMFAWAKEVGHVKANPALDVPKLGSGSEGFHTWEREEVEAFEAYHPIGSKARLAFSILLFTGVRRSDAIKLGHPMERDGALHFQETKGAKRRGRGGRPAPGPKRRVLPILPQLRAIIEATPKSGHMTYLVSERGRPFSSGSFGNRFRKWCNEAGLPHCTAHGLRKAGATIAAENGATAHQLMALFGWESIKQAEGYTRKADSKRLSADAVHLLVRREEQNGVESVPPIADDSKVGHRLKKGGAI